jgi:hypothetical protein
MTLTNWVMTRVIGEGSGDPPDEVCFWLLCEVPEPVWAAVVPVGAAATAVPAPGVAGPVETAAAATAPVPAVAIGEPEDERELPWVRRRAPRPEARVGILPSATVDGVVVPVDGVVVGVTGVGAIGDRVSVDVAATGADRVGVTAGVLASGEVVTEKAPVVADELVDGRDAGTTGVVWVEVLHPRPWHTVELELKVEVPVTAGRPFTLGVVVLAWAVVVALDATVDVPDVVVVVSVTGGIVVV